MRNFLRDERGLGNFFSGAFVLMVLFAVAAAVVALIQVWGVKVAVQQAAFEGVRVGVASDRPVEDAEIAAVKFVDAVFPGIKKVGGSVSADADVVGSPPNAQLDLTVRSELPFKGFSGWLGKPVKFAIEGRSSARVEETP